MSLSALRSLALLIASGFLASLAASTTLNAIGALAATDVMLARASATPLYAALSLVLGAAVALGSLARVNEALIGVAVAAALIPPIAASSAFAVMGLWNEALRAAALLATNLAGLATGSTAVLSVLMR